MGAAQPERLLCNVATLTLPTHRLRQANTQAVDVTGGRTLYLSGQVGIASEGSVPEDAEAQCALAWRNLQAQLRAAGMEIGNPVKITTIVRDPADVAKVRAGRAAVLGTHRAASTLIIGGLSTPAWKSRWSQAPDRKAHRANADQRGRDRVRRSPPALV